MPTTTGKKIAIVTGSALGLGYEPASSSPTAGWWPVSTSMPNVRPN